MKKLMAFALAACILCLGIPIAASADTGKIKIGYYNTESGKMEIGTASLMLHHPSGMPDITYSVIDEGSYRNSGETPTEDVIAKLKAVESCTNEVFDGGIDFSGKPIIYKNFGRVDSNAYTYSLTIAPLVVPMLEERYAMKAGESIWFALGNKEGRVIRVYLELPSQVEDATRVSMQQDAAYIYGTDDEHMSPESPAQRQEACAMLYRLLKQNGSIGDFQPSVTTASFWSKNAMDYMVYIGMYPVTPNLGENISRGEAFKLFCISLGYSSLKNKSYDYYSGILQGKAFVIGDENGDLNLDQSISRAEFCKIYNMITGRDKMKLVDTEGQAVTPEYYGFVDLDENAWYYDTMLKATSAYTNAAVDKAKRADRSAVDNY